MRLRVFVIGSLSFLGLVALFAIFIAVRGDEVLVGALSAAGTVAAGVFAAVAAVGSLRAAAESRAAAEGTRIATSRTLQPRLTPIREPGRGVIQVTGATAIDVSIVWQVQHAPTVTGQAPRLSSGEEFALAVPEGQLVTLWADYRDASGAFRWQDTWDGELRLLSSHLVD